MVCAPGRSPIAALRGLVPCVLASWVLVAAPARAHAQDDLLGPDKPLHFAATTLLSLGSYSLAASLHADRDLRFAVAFAVPLGAGLAKELFDAAAGGDASRGDFAWDLLGTMTGVMLAWLFGELIFPQDTARTVPSPRAPSYGSGPPPSLLLHEVATER